MSERGDSGTAKILDLIDQLAISMERGFVAMRSDMDALRGEIGTIRGEIGTIRGEIGNVRGELKSEIATLRYDMNERFDRVDGRFDNSMPA